MEGTSTVTQHVKSMTEADAHKYPHIVHIENPSPEFRLKVNDLYVSKTEDTDDCHVFCLTRMATLKALPFLATTTAFEYLIR